MSAYCIRVFRTHVRHPLCCLRVSERIAPCPTRLDPLVLCETLIVSISVSEQRSLFLRKLYLRPITHRHRDAQQQRNPALAPLFQSTLASGCRRLRGILRAPCLLHGYCHDRSQSARECFHLALSIVLYICYIHAVPSISVI